MISWLSWVPADSTPSAVLAVATASKSAVLPFGLALSASTAALTLRWSPVGGTTTRAVSSNVTRPTWTSAGTAARYASAAWIAAAMRVVLVVPIFAVMLPDRSMVSIVRRTSVAEVSETSVAVEGTALPPIVAFTLARSIDCPGESPTALK